MAVTIVVPESYGYTVLIALGVIPFLAWVQGSVSTSLRSAARTPYPNLYASPDQVKNDQAAYRFNCSQRAHGNLLENMPQTMATLLFSGLFYPTAAPILGAIWVAFRLVYAYGYIQGSKPNGKGRLYGSGFWFAQFGLMGLSVSGALKLL